MAGRPAPSIPERGGLTHAIAHQPVCFLARPARDPRRGGDEMIWGKGAPLPESFWGQVEKTETCWLWTGRGLKSGYGRFSASGRECLVHRIVYVALVGEIPAGLEIDHLCRTRNCVNPGHLEAVTHRENMLRGHTIIADQVKRTHCPKGHSYSDENTIVERGSRRCKICKYAGVRRWKLRKTAEASR